MVADYSFTRRATVRNNSRADSMSSAISSARMSGSGKLSESSKVSSLSQEVSNHAPLDRRGLCRYSSTSRQAAAVSAKNGVDLVLYYEVYNT